MNYALRNLIRRPGFSLICIVTLALGIAATTAVFSVVDHVLLRPLPYPDSDRLVSIATSFSGLEFVASPEYVEWRRSNHVLEQMAAWPHSGGSGYLTIGDEPVKVGQTRVSDNFFDALRVYPVLGRGFLPKESDAIVISHGLWTRDFASDAHVLGRKVIFEGEPYTIVGVLPKDFQFPEQRQADILTPLPISKMTDRREMRTWNTIGRLRPGVTFEQARAEFEQLFERARGEHSEMYRQDTKLRFLPYHEYRVRGVRLTLLILLGAAGCVLLIACANIANLLMVRAVARQGELRIRRALGASAWHLVSLPLMESLLLAALGGMAGAGLATGSLHLLRRFGPSSVPGLGTVTVDVRVLLFTVAASLLTGLVCGLIPAMRGRSQWTGRFVVVAEVALSLILLISAGLLIKSLYLLQNQNMGFQSESVLTANVSFTGIPVPERLQAVRLLQQLPGVLSMAVSDGLPPGGGGGMMTFSRSDRPLPEPWHRGDNMLVRRITAGYFPALGTPLLKGRFFHDGEKQVAIINESLARRYFAGENPLGKQIDGVANHPWRTIVGIVADSKNRGLDQPSDPEMFVPFEMSAGDTTVSMVMRGVGDPLALVPSVRASLRLPVAFRSLQANLSDLEAGPRFHAALFGTFAAIALVLAMIGIYGVLSYTVAQRTHEIGIRMALGAWTPDIVKLIVQEAMALTLSGVGIGIAGALGTARVLAVQLYGVQLQDAVTFGAVSVLVVTTTLLATYLPARRATRVEPAIALRAE